MALLAPLAGLAGCGSPSDNNHAPDATSGSQETYVELIDGARKQLIKGRVVYTELPEHSRPGSRISFEAVVSGDEVKQSPPPSGPPSPSGTPSKEGQASVGARVGVRLNCSGADVKCTPHSQERQNVLTDSDAARWRWTIEPRKPGELSVSLTTTAYLAETDNVLREHEEEPQSVRVERSPTSTALQNAKGLAEWLLLALGALGGVGGVVSAVALLRRRLRARRTEEGNTGGG